MSQLFDGDGVPRRQLVDRGNHTHDLRDLAGLIDPGRRP